MQFSDVFRSVHEAGFNIQSLCHVQSVIEVIHSFSNIIILRNVVSVDE